MMPNILLLGVGDPYHRHIRYLQREGYRVVAIDRNPNAEGRKHADIFLEQSIMDLEGVTEAIKKHEIDLVIATTEQGIRTAATANDRLGLPGLPINVANAATDKGAMRQRWAAAGLSQPKFKVVETAELARLAIGQFGSCVVKPTVGWASRGVSVINNPSDVDAAIDDAFAVSGGPVIVEEFIPGPLLTAEGFVSDGAADVVLIGDVTTQALDRHRVNMTLCYPGNFSPEILSEARDLITKGALALGLVRTPFHCECLVGPNGVELVELAARGGGGHIFSVLYEPLTGVSGIVRQARLALGETVGPLPQTPIQGGCYKFLSASPGTLIRVEGVDKASKMPGVIDIGISIAPGEKGGMVAHDIARHGHLCTTGVDRAHALAHAEDAANCVRFIMAPN
jgi:biotin carboxylase